MTGLADVVKLMLWCVVVGFVACGAAWYGGHRAFSAAMKAIPCPQACRGRRLRKELARGLAEIETYLDDQRVR